MAKGKRTSQRGQNKGRGGGRKFRPRKMAVVETPAMSSIRHDTGRPVTVEWVMKSNTSSTTVHEFSPEDILWHQQTEFGVSKWGENPPLSIVHHPVYQGFQLHQVSVVATTNDAGEFNGQINVTFQGDRAMQRTQETMVSQQ